MTATESPAGTALEQVAPGVIAQVTGSKTLTVADLADMLAAPVKPVARDADFPPVARPVAFTDALRKHLRAIPELFGKVMPTERRRLEAAEIADLTREANAIDVLVKELGTRRKAISELMRMHQDFQAQAEGHTERVAGGIAKGHILAAAQGVPFTTEVEGYGDPWKQVYVSGGTDQSKDVLDKLLADGTITQAEHNGFTRSERVLDDLKILGFVRRHPVRGLEILKAITVREAPGTSLVSPKK